MFQQIIADLKCGKLPDSILLRKRFEAALVKKMGVIRTPYSFWPGDPKINPPAKHLLWAVTLLEDKENCNVVEAIIAAELEEKRRAKGHTGSQYDLDYDIRRLMAKYLCEFIELAPSDTLAQDLRTKTTKLFPAS